MESRTQLSQGLELGGHTAPTSGQIVGYARVSTEHQKLDRQIAALENAGVQKLWAETISGASRDRPELGNVLNYLREGDTLVVASMDRLARSLLDLSSIVTELTNRGVAVRFLKEELTYTADSDAVSQLMLGILGSIAQFERALIRERQAEGIAAAKARGAYGKPAMTPEQITQARELIALGVPKAEVARRLSVARSTLYKYAVTPISTQNAT